MSRRPTLPRRLRRVPGVVALLLGAALLGGCLALPTSGPVVESDLSTVVDDRQASDIDAVPPAPGASRLDVVTGFLDAMTAWPIKTSVAKQYLTEEAAAQWNPERETIVYGDTLPARESGPRVEVRLTSADLLDEVGGWRGPLGDDELTQVFRVTVEHGEYRIVDPRDALVVPATWFQQRYRQVSLYYFDPLAEILVPEPVFVPAGDQLATRLVSGLLAGPPPLARGVVRSYLPAGLGVGLSVPVDADGVAHLTLAGDAPQVSAREAELILAQLSWTLRQDPAITALRVSIGGTALPAPGGASPYPVDGATRFDPAGADATGRLFGVADGRLVAGSAGNLATVAGPFGVEDAGLTAVAVRPDAREAAVVDRFARVRVGPVETTSSGSGALLPRTLLSGGTYARPSWDVAGRLWMLERRSSGAVVWLLEGDELRQVEVPGVTGRRARMVVVSRDGTRLVSVVRTGAGDRVLASRVEINGRGRVESVRDPLAIRSTDGGRVLDIAWAGPVRIALLSPTAPGRLYEVDVVSSDGASVGVDLLSTIVAGRVLGLAATPRARTAMYAVYADDYVDLVRQETFVADPGPLTQLDYAG